MTTTAGAAREQGGEFPLVEGMVWKAWVPPRGAGDGLELPQVDGENGRRGHVRNPHMGHWLGHPNRRAWAGGLRGFFPSSGLSDGERREARETFDKALEMDQKIRNEAE
jgi:hypothetical protein